jgi:phosphate/sulfate permease
MKQGEIDMISCTTLRSTVVLSAGLFLSGILLLLIAETTGLPVPTAHLALFAVLGGALALALTFIVAVMPGIRHHFDNCEH